MSEIKPALTAEEWDEVLHPVKYFGDEKFGRYYVRSKRFDDHGTAAANLHGQPFGFTWEDVDWLTKIADSVHSDLRPHDEAKGRNLRDRIAALLPPRGTKRSTGPKTTLEEFAKAHDLVLRILERHTSHDSNVYTAHFENAEVEEIEGVVVRGVYGEGATPEAAMNDYCRMISCRRLVIPACSIEQKEVYVPQLVPSNQDTAPTS